MKVSEEEVCAVMVPGASEDKAFAVTTDVMASSPLPVMVTGWPITWAFGESWVTRIGMKVCSVNGVVKLACAASSNLRLPLITALGTCSVALELEALTTVKLVLPIIHDATRLRLVPLTVHALPAGPEL